MDKLTLEEVRQKKEEYVRSQNFTFAFYMRELEKRMMGNSPQSLSEQLRNSTFDKNILIDNETDIKKYASGDIDLKPFKKLYNSIKQKLPEGCQFVPYAPIPSKIINFTSR